MFNKRPLPWNDFVANLQTFDIVLMHGLFKSSLAVESVEGCDWSHSAIVVVAKDLNLPNIDPETRLLWESNINEVVQDVILGVSKDGPQLTRLQDRVSYNFSVKYDSNVGARKLYLPRTPDMFATLQKVIQNVHSAHFPPAPSGDPDPGDGEMNNFLMGRFKNLPVADGSFFCSQLVAHTFQALGLITQAYVSNGYAPVDFAEALDVSLLDGWLGREIMLDTDTIPPFTH